MACFRGRAVVQALAVQVRPTKLYQPLPPLAPPSAVWPLLLWPQHDCRPKIESLQKL